MTEYDWLLIYFGAGLAVFLTSQRLARALFSLALIWLATFTSAQIYREVAFRTQAVTGSNMVLAEVIIFDLILILFFVVGYILLKIAFPVTNFPNIDALDYIAAFLVGIVVAVLFVALLSNSLGVMVREQSTDNTQGWITLQWRVSRSFLRPYARRVMSVYGWTFAPFFPGLPGFGFLPTDLCIVLLLTALRQ